MKAVRLNVYLRITLLAVLVVAVILWGNASSVQALSGSVGIHDPSVIQAGSCYYAFGTGTWLPILRSCNGMYGPWSFLRNTFASRPAWIEGAIGSAPGNLWAPDINYVNGQYRLYYAASTFGSNRSVIGLATASNIEGPWTDAGEVLRSTSSNNYNAIDPDYIEGKLAFGSFWDGIKMIDIGSNGKRSGTAMYNLASRGGGAIEAPSIVHNGSTYYLFVSFDKCCDGVNSTYRTMVGRSSSITGPYTAQNGTAMMSGGATQILATNGNEIGPGGGDANGLPGYFAYHFYDGAANGASKLQIRPITYSNGWPVLGVPITSNTPTSIPPTSIPTTSVPPTFEPGVYQSENATVGGGATVDSNNAGFFGTGFVNFPASGGYVEFRNVDGGTGGSRTLHLRNALASGSRTGQLVVNGASQNITFAATGSWTTWTVHQVTVNLNAGTGNTIRLQSTGQDLANIDQLEVAGGTTVTAVPPTNVPPTAVPPTNMPPTGVPPTSVPPTNDPNTACSPVASVISVPFTFDGAGTFCWQTSNPGSYINSWNLARLNINGVDITNRWVGSGSYPPAINGQWYIGYTGNFAWSHVEVR